MFSSSEYSYYSSGKKIKRRKPIEIAETSKVNEALRILRYSASTTVLLGEREIFIRLIKPKLLNLDRAQAVEITASFLNNFIRKSRNSRNVDIPSITFIKKTNKATLCLGEKKRIEIYGLYLQKNKFCM